MSHLWDSPYYLDPLFSKYKQITFLPISPTCSCLPGWRLMSCSVLTAHMSVKERRVAQCLIKWRGRACLCMSVQRGDMGLCSDRDSTENGGGKSEMGQHT